MFLGKRFKGDCIGLGATFLGLLCINFVIFNCHFAGECSFTYDFIMGYHPPTSFIVESLRQGVWPSWVAQQSLGYPLYLHVQSDIFYPVTWLFAFFDTPYTLQAANIVQIIHVNIGALGVWYLLEKRGIRRDLAVCLALAYFFMGGFFIQSQHVDYVRGFVLTPWCIALVHFNYSVKKGLLGQALSILAIAIVFSLFFLGAYPGQIVALGYVMTLSVLISLCVGRNNRYNESYFHSLGLIFVGVLIASAFLLLKYLPFASDFKEVVARSSNAHEIVGDTFRLSTIFSFFHDITRGNWPGNFTVQSFFITSPIFICFLLLSASDLKRNYHEIILLAASLFVATGFFKYIAGGFSGPLGYSRIPSADYKGIVLVYFIVIVATLLNDLINNKKRISTNHLLFTFVVFTALFGIGSVRYVKSFSYQEIVGYLCGCLLLLSFQFFKRDFDKFRLSRYHIHFLSIVLFFGVLAHAMTLYLPAEVWKDHSYIKKARWFTNFDVMKGVPDSSWISNDTIVRPERVDLGHKSWFTSRGFYTGLHIIKGYDATKNLTSHSFLWENENFSQLTNKTPRINFFQSKGVACLLPSETKEEDIESIIANIVDSETLTVNCNSVDQLSYRMGSSAYSMNLSQPALLIENEIYWKWWRGHILKQADSIDILIEPLKDYSPYRVWQLPEGKYIFKTEFVDKPMDDSRKLFINFFKISLLLTTCYLFFTIKFNRKGVF